MALTLILLRHAKSGWDDVTAQDHERTLTQRGRTDAQAVGAWLRDTGNLPDKILSSDATRTGQTVHHLLTGAAQHIETEYTRKLYNASADTVLHLIRQQTAQTLLVCGHNPGMGLAAQRLATLPPHHTRFDDYPTAAATVIRFTVSDWADIRSGECVAFIVPADLKRKEPRA